MCESAKRLLPAQMEVKGATGIIHTNVRCSQTSTNRWFAQRYNQNNAWNFNGNNGELNNNNLVNELTVQAVANLLTNQI